MEAKLLTSEIMRTLITLLLPIAFVSLGCHDDNAVPGRDFMPIETDGATLAVELDLPPGPGPFPALIMVHGSGKLGL